MILTAGYPPELLSTFHMCAWQCLACCDCCVQTVGIAVSAVLLSLPIVSWEVVTRIIEPSVVGLAGIS